MEDNRRVIGTKSYITKDGDMFDTLSLAMYGDETKASDIIKFNPDYAGYVRLPADVVLRLPVFSEDTVPKTLAPWRR